MKALGHVLAMLFLIVAVPLAAVGLFGSIGLALGVVIRAVRVVNSW